MLLYDIINITNEERLVIIMMTREEMQDIMVGIYGLEHEVTIGFFKKCEQLEDNSTNNKCLELMVECHRARPLYLNDNE